jgi:hypothetical protein
MLYRAALAATALLAVSHAQELARNLKLSAELYESGIVHEQLMAMKHVSVKL